MSTQLSQFRVMRTLVKREFLEHRLLFVYMPIAATLLSVLLVATWFIRVSISDDGDRALGIVGRVPAFEPGFSVGWMRDANGLFTSFYRAPLEPMMLLFWLSMVSYYLFSLYRQRQDRSILFWNSLPVSDAQALGSKLVAGLLGCHLVYVLCLFAQDLCMLLNNILFAWHNGFEVRAGITGSLPSSRQALTYLLFLPLTILWSLPVYAWLLLASAMAPRAPFAWAAGPLMLLIIPEVIITERSWILLKIFQHAFPIDLYDPNPVGRMNLSFTTYPWSELAVSVLLGLALLYAAVRLNRPDDR